MILLGHHGLRREQKFELASIALSRRHRQIRKFLRAALEKAGSA